MRIETENLLIIKETKVLPYIIAIIFIILGISQIVILSSLEKSLIFFLFGIIPIILASTRIITVDKTVGKLTISDKSFVRNSKDECNIKDIEAIEFEDSHEGKDRLLYTKSFVVLKSKKKLLLSTNAASRDFFGRLKSHKDDEMPKKIAAFLDVKYREIKIKKLFQEF